MLRKCLVILIILWHLISVSYADECGCNCQLDRESQPVCDIMKNLQEKIDVNTRQLDKWENYRPFVERSSEKWEKEISHIVEMKINEYVSKGKFYPKPENLVRPSGNEMQDDSNIVPKSSEDGTYLVHDLVAQLEVVKRRTIKVEEELENERSTRRRLEKSLKENQSSLISLGKRINVTVPADAMMDQIQKAINSSLHDMNKSLYENHLKKLYHTVYGVAYKNEIKGLFEKLKHVETELQTGDNIPAVSKLTQDLNTTNENMHHLNNSIENAFVPLTLEFEKLERKFKNELNYTEQMFKRNFIPVLSTIKNIKRFAENFQSYKKEWSKSVKTLQNQIEHFKGESVLKKPVQGRRIAEEDPNGTFWNCHPLDLSEHPDLVLERQPFGQVIIFRCAGGKQLFGTSITHCKSDGYWTHMELPWCRD